MPLNGLRKRFAARNPKGHRPEEIADSIDERGFVAPPVLDERTGKFAAGHGRIMGLEILHKRDPAKVPRRIKVDGSGGWLVPVLRGVAFDDAQQAEEYLVADNRLVELGGWQLPGLAAILERIRSRGRLRGVVGYTDTEVERIIREARAGRAIGEDGVPKPPKNPTTKLGDVWILGTHRLVCGDCTDPEAVKTALDGERAVLMCTDPPYGVAYTDDTRVAADRAHVRPLRMPKWEEGIDNDEKTGADIQPFLESELEIDPGFCDVIVKRWERLTGGKASRLELSAGQAVALP